MTIHNGVTLMNMNGVAKCFAVGLCVGVAWVSSATVCAAEGGVIRFSGEIFEASCEVSAVADADFGAQGQRIKVAPGIEVVLNAASRVCSGRAPFTTRFEPLPSIAGVALSKTASGTVVLTYL